HDRVRADLGLPRRRGSRRRPDDAALRAPGAGARRHRDHRQLPGCPQLMRRAAIAIFAIAGCGGGTSASAPDAARVVDGAFVPDAEAPDAPTTLSTNPGFVLPT